jgi:hypothetical protein
MIDVLELPTFDVAWQKALYLINVPCKGMEALRVTGPPVIRRCNTSALSIRLL